MTLICARELRKIKSLKNITVIDVTNYNFDDDELQILKHMPKNVIIRDLSKWGKDCSIDEYLFIEESINKFIEGEKIREHSPFERYLLAYHYATLFSTDNARILKRLCDKLSIQSSLQECYIENSNHRVLHLNLLVYIDDHKYNIDGLYYSDPFFDSKFAQGWNFNLFAIPIKNIGKIFIRTDEGDFRVSMNDFLNLYYSRKINQEELNLLSINFSKSLLNKMIEKKYCKEIQLEDIALALEQTGHNDIIDTTIKGIANNKKYFIYDCTTSEFKCDEELREEFKKYLYSYANYICKKQIYSKLDCATLINFIYRNYFDIDLLNEGIGKSWSGKILTSNVGSISLCDEGLSIRDKTNFILNNCKAGDILFFHRQSLSDTRVEEDNYYPGHCAIYLGNNYYLDSRLTSRGDIAIVDIKNDEYLESFIGYKDVLSEIQVSYKPNFKKR